MSDLVTPPFNPLRYPLAVANPRWITNASSWVGHIPFGMALIQMLRPSLLVELGTLKGDSFCGFCQSVAELNLPTKCFAVDTWQGDLHVGAVDEAALSALRAHVEANYPSFANLIQKDFDSAAKEFQEGSIDLLHIDGCHTYEAVKHDFEIWKPRLSPRAVVLFHDTDVRRPEFGVWRFWEELSPRYPHFTFTHAFGLGVLGYGPDLPEEFRHFLETAGQTPDLVRKYFNCIGHRLEVFKVANIMIDGLKEIHQMTQNWQRQTNHEVKDAASAAAPQREPINFVQSIEVQVYEMIRDDLALRERNR